MSFSGRHDFVLPLTGFAAADKHYSRVGFRGRHGNGLKGAT